jgi:hypothetical protein
MQNLADRIELELWQGLTAYLYERFQGDAAGLYRNEAKEWIFNSTYLYIDMIVWNGCDRIKFLAIQQYQKDAKSKKQ